MSLTDEAHGEIQDPKFESIFLSNQCIEHLGPLLLRFDPPNLLNKEELKAEEFVEDKSKDVMQKLNWYYFMLQRDVKNKVCSFSSLPSKRSLTSPPYHRPVFVHPLPSNRQTRPSSALYAQLPLTSLNQLSTLSPSKAGENEILNNSRVSTFRRRRQRCSARHWSDLVVRKRYNLTRSCAVHEREEERGRQQKVLRLSQNGFFRYSIRT